MPIDTEKLFESKKMLKKIGVFLPISYKGGTLNGAKNIAKMLHLGSRLAKEPVTIIFSCVANFYNINEEFKDLTELGIIVRETDWKFISRHDLKLLKATNMIEDFPLLYEQYLCPSDGINDFHECDFWLLISDRTSAPLAPIKPYGLVVYDYIQRYVPEIFPEEFNDTSYLATARQAKFVLATTPSTQQDTIQYAGVSPERVHLALMEFNPFNCKQILDVKEKEEYFIWTTNTTEHKNHLRALEALNIYYNQLRGKLKVIITGTFTELFLDNQEKSTYSQLPYIRLVRETLNKKQLYKGKITIKGNLSTNDYVQVLKNAKFLWHPALVDNGTFSVIEAAYYGVPSLSSDYPQMRFINERFQLNLKFFNQYSAQQMANELKSMEENYPLRQKKLPSKTFLEQFSYPKLALEFWQLFRKII